MPAPGRCNQSSYLKVASPPPAKAAKVYVMHAPRTHAASRHPCAAPARVPHPTPAGRALRERARNGAGPPGRRWAERLPRFCSLAGEGKKGRPGPGWLRRSAIRVPPGPQRAVARARRGRLAGAPGPRAPWPRREMTCAPLGLACYSIMLSFLPKHC